MKISFLISVLSFSFPFLFGENQLPKMSFISKDNIASIISSPYVQKFFVHGTQIKEYPINDILVEFINTEVQQFWKEYAEKYTDDNNKKQYALSYLDQKNREKNQYIKLIADKGVARCAYVIWGYALLIIYYQIVHSFK